jgi:uncharacterized protein (UPF0248 family)
MRIMDRLLLRGLQPFLPEGAEVLAMDRVKADALGEERKANVVLTQDHLLIVTSARLKSVLTEIPRADIRSVQVIGPDHVAVGFEDFNLAMHRVIEIRLRRKGDRNGLLAQLEAGPADQGPVS